MRLAARNPRRFKGKKGIRLASHKGTVSLLICLRLKPGTAFLMTEMLPMFKKRGRGPDRMSQVASLLVEEGMDALRAKTLQEPRRPPTVEEARSQGLRIARRA